MEDPCSSGRAELDRPREAPDEPHLNEVVNLLPVRNAGKRRVLPADEDPGVPHHGHQEARLALRETERGKRSIAIREWTICTRCAGQDRLGPARCRRGGGSRRAPGRRTSADRSIERQAWALLCAQLAPVGLSVKVPWQYLRGTVQGSARRRGVSPRRSARGLDKKSGLETLSSVEP